MIAVQLWNVPNVNLTFVLILFLIWGVMGCHGFIALDLNSGGLVVRVRVSNPSHDTCFLEQDTLISNASLYPEVDWYLWVQRRFL